jgi:hypothetical protein
LRFSKLDDDAFTRVRVILGNGIENEAWLFQHQLARVNRDLREPLARVRRAEHHQQTVVNWTLPADQSVLETTIGYEQVAVEVTASVASHEPDPYLRGVYHFGLLEDFDHLYRYTAPLDRLEGKDANNLLQSYTDIRPGRPTMIEHRSPLDDVRRSYDRQKAAPITKLNALTVLAAEQQTRNYYATVGPLYADPLARALYAEISSIEEQHVTQIRIPPGPDESWMEKWLLHEATEIYNYLGCMEQEGNAAVKKVWQRMLEYELGHLQVALEHYRRLEPKRDPFQIIPAQLPPRADRVRHPPLVRPPGHRQRAGSVGHRHRHRPGAAARELAHAGLSPADGCPELAVGEGRRRISLAPRHRARGHPGPGHPLVPSARNLAQGGKDSRLQTPGSRKEPGPRTA